MMYLYLHLKSLSITLLNMNVTQMQAYLYVQCWQPCHGANTSLQKNNRTPTAHTRFRLINGHEKTDEMNQADGNAIYMKPVLRVILLVANIRERASKRYLKIG